MYACPGPSGRPQHGQPRAAAAAAPYGPGLLVEPTGSTSSPSASQFSDQVVIAQESLDERRLAMVYGYQGRVTAAVTVNMASRSNTTRV
jgi:hypothetical protein